MQIIVLGMHRSGTSLITRIVNMMGAYFGPENLSLGLSPDNPKGFWERRDILRINQAILQHTDCSWFHLIHWDETRLSALPAALNQTIAHRILEMDSHRPWVMKDPRLCLTFPCWKPFLEVPVALIVWRDPLEIARSLELRNNLPISYGMALWEYHAVGIIRHAASLPKIYARHADMMASPVNTTHALYAALVSQNIQGLRLPGEHEILAFVEPKLYRARNDNLSYRLNKNQERLSSMLRGELPFDSTITVSENARTIMMGKSVGDSSNYASDTSE